jgi:hypothetical protein
LPIHVGDEEFPEIGDVYVVRGKSDLVEILAGASQIIMRRQNVHRSDSLAGRE